MSKLNNVFMSNHLTLLADALKDNLFKEKSGHILRTIVIIPSNTVKSFLVQYLIEKLGFVFGLRFLTLPQAVEYFTKLTRKSERKIPNHFCLMLHLQSLIRQIQSPELSTYLQGDQNKIISLAEEMSHVFLFYGLYGGEALKKWEEKNAWQQQLWKKLKSHWDFPCDLFEQLEPPSISHQVHLFDLSFIPPLYQKFFTYLENYWDLFYYYRSPTPHFWGDTLSKRSAAFFDQSFEKKGISEKERIDFAALVADTHPLLANLSSQAKPLFNFLIEKSVSENYLPFEETNLLHSLKNDIYHIQMRKLIPDDSIEICQAPSKLREVEALLHQLKKYHYHHRLDTKDVIVYLVDVDAYFPFIQFVFESDDSPFGYRVNDLSARLQNTTLQTLELFFHILESRFEPELIFQLISSPVIRVPFPKEDLLFFQKLIELSNVHWGFNEKMRREILEIPNPSQGGTWSFAFDNLIQNLPFLSSPIDLSKAESLGEFIHFIETLHQDLSSFKQHERTLQGWIEAVQVLLERYFVDKEEVLSFRKEFCKIKPLADLLKEENFSFMSIQKIFKEIFHQKGENQTYQDKPMITFSPIGEGMIGSTSFICILGLNEETFPRKSTHRSINELKNAPGSDAQPSIHEKDRLFFLQAILSAGTKIYLSYVGISERDGKELGPTILIQELLQILPGLVIQKEPPFGFSKHLIEKEHFSKKNYALACAHYFPELSLSSLEILSKVPSTTEEIDISALLKLARHPLQFYCNETLGIFFEKKDAKEDREFILSYLDQAILKNKALTQSLPEILREAKVKNLLPTALLNKVANGNLQEDIEELKGSLKTFSLEKGDFLTIRFDPACKSMINLTPETFILPPITLEGSSGQIIHIHGDLPHVTRRGIFCQGKEEFKETWKFLPHLLLLASAGLPIPNTLLFGKSGTEKHLAPIDVKAALRSYVDYYLEALGEVSPLMPDRAESYAKGKIKELASSNFIEDPYLEFIKVSIPKQLQESGIFVGRASHFDQAMPVAKQAPALDRADAARSKCEDADLENSRFLKSFGYTHEKWIHHAGALCKIIC